MRALLSTLIVLVCLPCAGASKVFPLLRSAQTLPIQLLSTNPWGAYSVTRRLSSAYTGSLYRVMRSSDAAVQDIGYTSGNIADTNLLVSFTGSGTAYLTKLYDQTGNGHHLDQVSGTNSSARLILSGTMKTDVLNRTTADFSGNVTNAIWFNGTIATNLPITYFIVIQPTAYALTSNRNICSAPTADWIPSVNQVAFGVLATENFAISNDSTGAGVTLTGDYYCTNVQYLATCYYDTGANSSLQIFTRTAVTGTAGNTTVAQPNLGAGSNGSDKNCADMKWSEWFIYTNALSADNTLTLQQNITNFYNFNVNTTCPTNSLNNGVISYWKMDETSGTRVDSRDSNDLADNNTVTSNTGIISNAGQFTAANSEYLSHASNASLAVGDIDFTFSYWAMLDTKPAQGVVISKFDSVVSGAEYLLDYVGGVTDRFRFTVSADGVAYVTVSANNLGAPATNTWYFVVQWHDKTANTINIQVNNGTVDTVSHSTGVLTGTSGFKLGAFLSTPAAFWNGRIDEVSFWKRILTSTERTSLYNSGAGNTCCPFTP